ncbi:hypothetical protein HPNQ4076_1117 [Helicobacter pylori NQ4076]|uniref:Uncharacterized protein n=1 Tax=Helicobacter pylori NQ4076 TaxID=992029 RepID=I9ZA96_HELPX|nr:hypothetical protein HPNQ4076_1117 [Helicobacter pylori NQ4076]
MSAFDESRAFSTLKTKTQTRFLKFLRCDQNIPNESEKSPNHKRSRDFKNEAKNKD